MKTILKKVFSFVFQDRGVKSLSSGGASSKPLLPYHHLLLTLSTFFATASLTFVVEPFGLRIFIPFVVIAVALIPKKFWSPFTRLMLFGVLVSAVILQAGGWSDEIGTSLLIITMLVKYVEMKTVRDATTMSLFNLIAPFTAFLQDQTPIILLMGLISIVLGLALMQSLHNQSFGTQSTIVRKNIWWVLKSFLLLLPFSIMLYAIAPRLDSPLWQNYTKRYQSGGLSEEMDVSSWGNMYENVATAFRVEFDGPIPPPEEMYFRGHTLWSFDGKKWLPKPLNESASKRVYQTRSRPNTSKGFSYTETYSINTKRLYALDYPSFIPELAQLYSDDSLITSKFKMRGQSVKWNSGTGTFSPLTPDEKSSALQLPISGNEKTKQWAMTERQKFQTDEQFAVFVKNHLRTKYRYTLSPKTVGDDSVDDFFITNKEGFCIHFSSAFTFIMRSVGIPSRVVTGYVATEQSDFGNFYRIRQADAHAWSEVWVDDKWVRFDATPSIGATEEEKDFSWVFWDKSYEVMDWARSVWETYIVYYDKSTQEKAISNLKDALSFKGVEKWVGRLSFLSALYAIVVTVVIFLLLGFIVRLLFKIKTSTLVLKYYKLLEIANPSINDHEWDFVKKASSLSELPKPIHEKLVNLAVMLNDFVFNPQTKIQPQILSKEIKDLRKVLKRKNHDTMKK